MAKFKQYTIFIWQLKKQTKHHILYNLITMPSHREANQVPVVHFYVSHEIDTTAPLFSIKERRLFLSLRPTKLSTQESAKNLFSCCVTKYFL